MKPVVVATGGNSLIDPALPPTVAHQFAATQRAILPIADLVERGVPLVITHGNGPQVGFMALRSELSKGQLHEVPFDSLVADTQGAIGYMMQQMLREELARRGHPAQVVAVVTEIEVAADDPAFANPTKPIGGFYSEAEAQRLMAERGWSMKSDAGRGWRRVVPSPDPKRVVQLDTIRTLVAAGVVVICCGGGGIPVVPSAHGLRGVEGVIDKDRASALLAADLGAASLIITTGVDRVYRDFLTDHPTPLDRTTGAELAKLEADGQFPDGSMGPKIQAARRFLAGGGSAVHICKPEALADALEGRAGTLITEPA